MAYPFIQITCYLDKQDNQYYNYYYDFSDNSLFRINCDIQEKLINRGINISIPSGLTYLGYVFLVFLSQFFNQFRGNVPIIICMVLIDLLSIIWIHNKVIEHYSQLTKRVKREAEFVSLEKRTIVTMMKKPEMIKLYSRTITVIVVSTVITIWSIKRFLILGTMEFFFLIPLLYWVADDETIDFLPYNLYRLIKLLKQKDNNDVL